MTTGRAMDVAMLAIALLHVIRCPPWGGIFTFLIYPLYHLIISRKFCPVVSVWISASRDLGNTSQLGKRNNSVGHVGPETCVTRALTRFSTAFYVTIAEALAPAAPCCQMPSVLLT